MIQLHQFENLNRNAQNVKMIDEEINMYLSVDNEGINMNNLSAENKGIYQWIDKGLTLIYRAYGND